MLTQPTVFVLEYNQDSIHVKLGDFGIAKREIDGTDTYVGSPAFRAPVSVSFLNVVSWSKLFQGTTPKQLVAENNIQKRHLGTWGSVWPESCLKFAALTIEHRDNSQIIRLATPLNTHFGLAIEDAPGQVFK